MHPSTNHAHQLDSIVPKVQNVIATFALDISQTLKLGDIAASWNNSRYNKRRFSGLIVRNQQPKATFMIFSNGKVIITGAKSETQCQLSSVKLTKKISKMGLLKSRKPKTRLQIRNIVASVNTKLKINLDVMYSRNLKQCSFTPDTFPGLIYRTKGIRNMKATFLVFSNGKIIINRVQTEAQAISQFRTFYKTLKKYRI